MTSTNTFEWIRVSQSLPVRGHGKYKNVSGKCDPTENSVYLRTRDLCLLLNSITMKNKYLIRRGGGDSRRQGFQLSKGVVPK